MSLALSISVLGLESVCPRKGCPWPWIFFVSLALSLVSSTPPLLYSVSFESHKAHFQSVTSGKMWKLNLKYYKASLSHEKIAKLPASCRLSQFINLACNEFLIVDEGGRTGLFPTIWFCCSKSIFLHFENQRQL